MKVEIERVGGGPVTFEDFVDANGFVVKVVERSGDFVGTDSHYFAMFDRTETMANGFLTGEHGNGKTPALAIANYRHKLRGKRLVYRAYEPERREVQCPTEWLPSSSPADQAVSTPVEQPAKENA